MFVYKGVEYFKNKGTIWRISIEGNHRPVVEIKWLRSNKHVNELTLALYNHFCKPEIINYKGDI